MYKQRLSTSNKSIWKNTCEYIILHHTGTPEWTIRWNINILTWKWNIRASAHYLIDINWDIYKIWQDSDILWHAWVSSWKWRHNFNTCSIWIEILWPLRNWSFTDKQKQSASILIKELSKKYAINKNNILRHKDISPWRKWDIADTFWNWEFTTWEDYKNNLFNKKDIMTKSKYTDIKNAVIQEVWFTPLFWTHEWIEPLTEQETKELIEIAFARFSQRLLK